MEPLDAVRRLQDAGRILHGGQGQPSHNGGYDRQRVDTAAAEGTLRHPPDRARDRQWGDTDVRRATRVREVGKTLGRVPEHR